MTARKRREKTKRTTGKHTVDRRTQEKPLRNRTTGRHEIGRKRDDENNREIKTCEQEHRQTSKQGGRQARTGTKEQVDRRA